MIHEISLYSCNKLNISKMILSLNLLIVSSPMKLQEEIFYWYIPKNTTVSVSPFMR